MELQPVSNQSMLNFYNTEGPRRIIASPTDLRVIAFRNLSQPSTPRSLSSSGSQSPAPLNLTNSPCQRPSRTD